MLRQFVALNQFMFVNAGFEHAVVAAGVVVVAIAVNVVVAVTVIVIVSFVAANGTYPPYANSYTVQ